MQHPPGGVIAAGGVGQAMNTVIIHFEMEDGEICDIHDVIKRCDLCPQGFFLQPPTELPKVVGGRPDR